LWNAVEIVAHVTEFGWPEEVALLIQLPAAEGPRRCLYLGDAICGGRDDIGVPAGEVRQYTLRGAPPEQISAFISDLSKAHGALERLLRLDFDALAFGHGEPVIKDSHAALRRLLVREALWKTGSPVRESRRG
jgi:hypothetical protein